MKTVSAYQCDHCGKLFSSKSSILRHEKACYRNPMTKSCISCEFFVKDHIPVTVGHYIEMKACLLNHDTSIKLKTNCPQYLLYEEGINEEFLIYAKNIYKHDEAIIRYLYNRPKLAKLGLEQ